MANECYGYLRIGNNCPAHIHKHSTAITALNRSFYLLMRIPLQPQPVPYRILPPHNLQRQRTAHTAEDEERPLPPERIDDDAEDEPVDQFGVGEEVEGSGRGATLEELGHVDPPLHPLWSRPRERVDEEHEEEARVDSDVVLVVFCLN